MFSKSTFVELKEPKTTRRYIQREDRYNFTSTTLARLTDRPRMDGQEALYTGQDEYAEKDSGGG